VDNGLGVASLLDLAGTKASIVQMRAEAKKITLKALSFFDDGDLALLPADMKLRLAAVAREVDLDRLPSIDMFTRQIDHDYGYGL